MKYFVEVKIAATVLVEAIDVEDVRFLDSAVQDFLDDEIDVNVNARLVDVKHIKTLNWHQV